MRIYKLYANITATGDAQANLNIIKNGRIKQIRWDVAMNSVVDNDEGNVELSLIPKAMINSNDSAGSLDQVTVINNGTSGGEHSKQVTRSVDVPVGAGEKLYLNAIVSGTPTKIGATCYVDVEE